MGGFQALSVSDALREIHRVITGIHTHSDFTSTVEAVADVVVNVVGFEVAVVSVVQPDGDLKTIAVAGSAEARSELIGVRRSRDHYDHEFDVADHWGALRFVPHERVPEAAAIGWIPDVPITAWEDAWHPMDALFAPLHSRNGEFIGVLSVDLPDNGRRPSTDQRNLLEVLAFEAGIAIENAQLNERLRAGEAIFRQAFDRAGGGMALMGVQGETTGRYLRVNPALCAMVGYTTDELMQLSPLEITHPDDRDGESERALDLLDGVTSVYRREKRYLHRDGHSVWVSVTGTIARQDDGSPVCWVSQIEDISQRRVQLDQLKHEARHDSLTGLPNRTMVFERLQESIATARRDQRPGAALFLDIDNFKAINNEHGHVVGDQVLAMIGQRLRFVVGQHKLVGRIGGDEFVIVADELGMVEAQELAGRVEAAVTAPITHRGRDVHVRISIGVGVIPTDGGDPEKILHAADTAMYAQKAAASNTIYLRAEYSTARSVPEI